MKKIKKTCNNCNDYIVCYGLEKAKHPEKGSTCPDWQLDFMEFQRIVEEAKEEDKIKDNHN